MKASDKKKLTTAIILIALVLAAYLIFGRSVLPAATAEPTSGREDTVSVTTGETASKTEAPAQSTAAGTKAPASSAAPETKAPATAAPTAAAPALDEHGSYTSKDDVALYIRTYGKLPDNFITKAQAQALGWSGGSLEPYAPGKCIGGDRFGNYEGLLAKKSGRTYTECDIDTLGASGRGAKRIVFSNDGLIYYTSDHYESFTLIWGEP